MVTKFSAGSPPTSSTLAGSVALIVRVPSGVFVDLHPAHRRRPGALEDAGDCSSSCAAPEKVVNLDFDLAAIAVPLVSEPVRRFNLDCDVAGFVLPDNQPLVRIKHDLIVTVDREFGVNEALPGAKIPAEPGRG
jgi:hypothetical protein